MRYALLIAYDGTAYAGWQIQKNGVTVQQKLTEALSRIGVETSVTASGRTDSGVHAAGQVCHFDANLTIPPEKIADAINRFLPPDIRVLKSAEAYGGFNANSSAKRKTYCYRIYLSPRANPLKDRYAVWINYPVDIEKLKTAATLFVGEHDFKAYCAAGSQVKTTVREIYSIDVKISESNEIEIYVCGNGFLYNMVRTLVGTMLYCAAGRIKEEDIIRSLSEGARSAVGKTMPANGLTLESVEYEKQVF